MALTAGDHESTMSEGIGHSGGTLPDFTESMTRGHWAGSPVVVQELTHYAVQIDISDLTSDTDAAQGLYAGFFRWVTERPQYDGVTVVPTGDNEGNVWAEGIMIGRKQLSPVDRIINVNRSGDYGSLSGFNLAIDNTSDFGADPAGFDDYLLTNGYEIINRPVKVYVVIDDVFYQIWGGIVSKTKYNLKVFQFTCKDIFEQAHKPAPPAEVVLQKYPDADSESVGKNVPIVFGDVLRTELINISGKSEPLQIGFSDINNTPISITAATTYNVDGNGKPYLLIKTPSYNFTENELIDSGVFYITVFKGTSQGILIIGNEDTTNPLTSAATTQIYLGKKLTETVTDFNTNNAYLGGTISDDVWFFRIYQFNSIYLMSDKTIHSFVQDALNSLDLSYWNKDKLTYDPIPELIDNTDNTENNVYEAPTVTLLNNDIDIEGDFIRLIPIFPKSLKWKGTDLQPQLGSTEDGFGVDDDSVLLDKDRSTSIFLKNDLGGFNRVQVDYEIEFPDDFIIENLDELYLCFDAFLDFPDPPTGLLSFHWIVKIEDQFEQNNFTQVLRDYPTSPISSNDLTINGLPNDYYKQGDDNGEDSDFSNEVNSTFLSTLFRIDSISDFKEALVSGRISISFIVSSVGNPNIKRFELKQIGFVGAQKLNTIKDNLFIKTKGELTGANQTNNVYRAMQHIMEDYDLISSGSIDYGNLSSKLTRSQWRVGRQVMKKKLSSLYLKELAAQGFIGIYPDRQGKRHTKSFLDDTANIWTHADDNGTIIKGSISRFEATPMNELYNDFTINYDWNPGLGQFNKQIFITNTNAVGEVDPYSATFPGEWESTGTDQDYLGGVPGGLSSLTINADESTGNITMGSPPTWAEVGGKISYEDGSNNNFHYATITSVASGIIYIKLQTQNEITAGTYTTGTLTDHGSNVRKWVTWVGGINSYLTAKGYWEICYNSWLKTQTVNKMPSELQDCKWFIDGAVYDGTGISDDQSAAHKFLANLIQWSTRQKNRAVYSIPISSQNVLIDLLDVVKFKDQKYTNGDFRTGYIEKIKVNPRTDTIDIEAILRPLDMEDVPPDGDLIIETGDAPDTITESGSWPNTITETGL
jgi:hypothetical protein